MKSKRGPARKIEQWFVYILRCGDGTYYTGITKDLHRRCKQHNAGIASRYTRSRLPTRLVYQEPSRSQSQALRREAAIKSLTRQEKMSMFRLVGVRPLGASRLKPGLQPVTRTT